MNPLRIIARIDLKNEDVVKGFQLEGWKKVGVPLEFAEKYYKCGADELMFIDTVASLFSREKILRILNQATKNIFIPITIGGGIKNLKDAKEILNNGADKIAVNTAFVKNPNLIRQFVETFGSQSVLLSVQAKKKTDKEWEVFMESGRENSKKNVFDWIKLCEKLGVGEILVTSIDNEGLKKGLDLELYKIIKKITNLPLIAGGGFGDLAQLNLIKKINLSGISVARIFHEDIETPNDLKNKICK